MFENKTILITGGTGSFGKKFIKLTLDQFNLKKIIVYSRDEMKQWNMSQDYVGNKTIEFVIGDIRDKERLISILDGVDIVVHAAATKIVPTAEYNPFECIKTNINGAMNLIEACKHKKIDKVIALSTDKASNPINLYGATKLASDKLFVAANSNNLNQKTKFSVVRYGNVIGSRGSVVPFFIEKRRDGVIPITDERMTRFMITLEQAIKIVWFAISDMEGGEIYVKKIPSMKILDIAEAVAPNVKTKKIGIRPGEKIHEQMIGMDEGPYTFEYEDYYKILPAINEWYKDKNRVKLGVPVPINFSYRSDTNKSWMSKVDLSNWIDENLPSK